MHSLFSGKYFYGLGKRKSAVAQVRVYEKGKGEIIVNGKEYNQYFPVSTLLGLIKSPLTLTGIKDISITAKIIGGGVSAQADALRHGISRALVLMQEESKLILKKEGHLTRDSRIVERKKPGRRKARRAHQWVKR
jgi:small subunit ribosomal protein S9